MNTFISEIRKQLFSMSDEAYRAFHSNLVPGVENILGVRLPMLRKLAKELANGDWKFYLECAQDDFYEEVMLQGLVIGCAKMDYPIRLSYIKAFVPKINNWAICDSFCSSLKDTKKHKQEMLAFLQPYLHSKEEFSLRFAIVMLMDYYISEEYIDRILLQMDCIQHEGYYVKMAVAWAISVCFVKFPEKTLVFLQNNNLDNFTYNKTLQKTIESLRVDQETKDLLRIMKRK